MADTPFPEHQPPRPGPGDLEVEVDLASFLPEGVELASADGDATADGHAPVDGELDGLAASDAPDGDGAGVAAAVIGAPAPASSAGSGGIDLDQLEADLGAVDAAIERLDAGTYGIDPATGLPIDDALLAEDPTRLH
jgi:hypothetical protein